MLSQVQTPGEREVPVHRLRTNDSVRAPSAYLVIDTETAQRVEAATVGVPSLWVYAHNLSFDLVTSRLPLLLVARGWQVTQLAVTGDSPWMRLSRGRRHLTLVDSWGWLRQ